MQLQWIFCSREWTLRYYNKLTQRLLRCQFMPELRKEESHSVTRNRTQSSMWPRFTITSSHMTNQVWSLHVSNLGKFLTKHHSPELICDFYKTLSSIKRIIQIPLLQKAKGWITVHSAYPSKEHRNAFVQIATCDAEINACFAWSNINPGSLNYPASSNALNR